MVGQHRPQLDSMEITTQAKIDYDEVVQRVVAKITQAAKIDYDEYVQRVVSQISEGEFLAERQQMASKIEGLVMQIEALTKAHADANAFSCVEAEKIKDHEMQNDSLTKGLHCAKTFSCVESENQEPRNAN